MFIADQLKFSFFESEAPLHAQNFFIENDPDMFEFLCQYLDDHFFGRTFGIINLRFANKKMKDFEALCRQKDVGEGFFWIDLDE